MNKIFTLFGIAVSATMFSQFTSPGNGQNYTLSSLSAAAPTVLVNNGTDYQMTANITISAGDNLVIDENTTLKIDGGIQLNIAGNYTTTATNFVVTATDPAAVFRGIHFQDTSTAEVKNTTFEYGGGIRVSTGNFLMDNCIVKYFKAGLVTSSAIQLSEGAPVFQNSQFLENHLAVFGSGANVSVAPVIQNNYLYHNTLGDSNRPQINLGPSGVGATTKVLNNTVIGNRNLTKVGGISVSSLLGVPNDVLIDGNIVTDNRYGITITGNNCTGTISNNILTDNDVETNPQNGGSGINLYGNMQIKIEKNQIRGSLWGVTLVQGANADLGGGFLGSVGENIFFDNGNGGNLFALFNNTSNNISATNNCWRENELSTDAMVEEVISHQVDDAALGLVNFSPYLCAETLATTEANAIKSSIYPNPSKGTFTFEGEKSGNISIMDMSGKIVHSGIVSKGKNTVSTNLKAGVYILLYQSEGKKSTTKLLVK